LETRVLKVTSVPLGTRVQSETLVLKEMWAPSVAQAQKAPLEARGQLETPVLKVMWVPLGTRVQSETLVLKVMWAPPVAQEPSETLVLKVMWVPLETLVW
jgi:hypothetical protein